MADHTWEDEVVPAMEASEWVLERLYDTFDELHILEHSEHGEFRIASQEVRTLITKLQDIRNDCYNRRDGQIEW